MSDDRCVCSILGRFHEIGFWSLKFHEISFHFTFHTRRLAYLAVVTVTANGHVYTRSASGWARSVGLGASRALCGIAHTSAGGEAVTTGHSPVGSSLRQQPTGVNKSNEE